MGGKEKNNSGEKQKGCHRLFRDGGEKGSNKQKNGKGIKRGGSEIHVIGYMNPNHGKDFIEGRRKESTESTSCSGEGLFDFESRAEHGEIDNVRKGKCKSKKRRE